MPRITVTVDGIGYSDDVEPRTLLVHYLRETLGKTGTVVGCDTSNCGSCTVHLDGRSVKSCNVLAVQEQRLDQEDVGHDCVDDNAIATTYRCRIRWAGPLRWNAVPIFGATVVTMPRFSLHAILRHNHTMFGVVLAG